MPANYRPGGIRTKAAITSRSGMLAQGEYRLQIDLAVTGNGTLKITDSQFEPSGRTKVCAHSKNNLKSAFRAFPEPLPGHQRTGRARLPAPDGFSHTLKINTFFRHPPHLSAGRHSALYHRLLHVFRPCRQLRQLRRVDRHALWPSADPQDGHRPWPADHLRQFALPFHATRKTQPRRSPRAFPDRHRQGRKPSGSTASRRSTILPSPSG